KTVIIENAERMNTEAQSCFLKTLEEPKGNTLILLLCQKPALLLPTIFSRCQTIIFSSGQTYQETPEREKMLQELLKIVGAELAVKFQFTKKVNLEGETPVVMLEVLQRYFRNTMLVKLGIIQPENNVPEYIHALPIAKIKKMIELLSQMHKKITTTNANPKLALEILLMEM
ncbi:MAG: hypothetical protein ACHQVK_02680, partial [Candidatus Paceibacterales bacterium]